MDRLLEIGRSITNIETTAHLLQQDFGEWRHEPRRPVNPEADPRARERFKKPCPA